MSEMSVRWIKCTGDVWCKLETVNLDHQHFNDLGGVYIVWHGGPKPATVRVGAGVIRDCLLAERRNTRTQHFAEFGLYVTWASVDEVTRSAVRSYLTQRLTPLVPDEGAGVADPRSVNLPW